MENNLKIMLRSSELSHAKNPIINHTITNDLTTNKQEETTELEIEKNSIIITDKEEENTRENTREINNENEELSNEPLTEKTKENTDITLSNNERIERLKKGKNLTKNDTIGIDFLEKNIPKKIAEETEKKDTNVTDNEEDKTEKYIENKEDNLVENEKNIPENKILKYWNKQPKNNKISLTVLAVIVLLIIIQKLSFTKHGNDETTPLTQPINNPPQQTYEINHDYLPIRPYSVKADCSQGSTPPMDAFTTGKQNTFKPKAWVCIMDYGIPGQILRIHFPKSTISAIAINPGFDAHSGNEDLWYEHRIVTKGTIDLQDADKTSIDFDTKARRGLTTIKIPHITTNAINITILGTLKPEKPLNSTNNSITNITNPFTGAGFGGNNQKTEDFAISRIIIFGSPA